MLKNALNWIRDRFQERSTKQSFVTLLFLLASLGVISPDTANKITTGIDTGQEVYHDGRDSVAATIDRGKAIFEEGRDLVEDTRDTGLYFWQKILLVLGAGMSVVGMVSKDAKQGREYDAREEMLKYKASVMGVDLDNTLPDM